MRYYYKYFLFLVSLSLKEVESEEHMYRCDYKYSDVARGWYKTHSMPAVWADARLRCVMEGAELATPTKNETKTALLELIRASTNSLNFFTGIHAAFSTGDFYSLKGVSLTNLITKVKLEWAKNKPSNKGNKEDCITMSKEGLIEDTSCNNVHPYICYRHGSLSTEHNECGTVDKEYRLDRRTGKCYKFHLLPRNFSRAFFTCSAEGGHLAIINSVDESQVLKDLCTKYKDIPVNAKYVKLSTLIGFHNWDEKHDWRTIHGQTLDDAGYSLWDLLQPNNNVPAEQCGAILNSNGKLKNVKCEDTHQFICEKDRRSLTKCLNECETNLLKGKLLIKEKQKKEKQRKERKRMSKLKLKNKHW